MHHVVFSTYSHLKALFIFEGLLDEGKAEGGQAAAKMRARTGDKSERASKMKVKKVLRAFRVRRVRMVKELQGCRRGYGGNGYGRQGLRIASVS